MYLPSYIFLLKVVMVFGINKNGIPADNWPNLFIDWLKAREIIE